jgi:tripartite-type tricarboxylate transporter receptor subunit TctC
MAIRLGVGIGAAALAAAIGLSSPGFTQTYPAQPVRIIVPFSPGSATDILARIIADRLADRWSQNVIVENRPGLSGTTVAAKSTADGYTLMLTSNGHTIAGVINKNLSFDPVKDFAGITPVANVPLVLITPTEMPAKDLKEFIALAKANPGKFNYPSPGLGSSGFIAGALFNAAAGVNIVHVPYKGAPESLTSIIRGDTQLYYVPVNVGSEHIVTGKVRALAVMTAERNPVLKDVPTLKEAGLDFVYDSWFGLMAPSATPRDIIAKINRDVVEILKTPDTKAKLDAQGVIPMPLTPEQFDKIIAGDTAKLTEMFKDGIK